MSAYDLVFAAGNDIPQRRVDIQAIKRLYQAMKPSQRLIFYQQVRAHMSGAPNAIDHPWQPGEDCPDDLHRAANA